MNEENKCYDEEGISLNDIFKKIKQKLVILVAIVVLFTIGGFSLGKIQGPTYTSRGTMIVSFDSGTNNPTNDYNYSKSIANSVASFIKQDVVLIEVSKDTNISLNELKANLNVSLDSSSLVITISYTSKHNKEMVQEVVDSVMTNALKVSNSTNEEGKPNYNLICNTLKIMSNGSDPIVQTQTKKDILIFFFLGSAVAFGYLLYIIFSDKTYRSVDEIEHHLGVKTIEIIPYIKEIKREEDH
ncbi:MAG: Wzz/FepE/Etk N-terminal domain-containing protein [Bacilli bacterium]|nr:Wzz/FepE/Etk N-terminal domain-containing protein [Bacilli bacterium]